VHPPERNTIVLTRKKIVVAVGGAVLVVGGIAGTAVAISGDDADDRPITGTSLRKATDAALAETGGGRVTDTEVDDEESMYEVEVTLDDGSQVDVQLDETFQVVGSETDDAHEDDD
jgi:hypothetical protein